MSIFGTLKEKLGSQSVVQGAVSLAVQIPVDYIIGKVVDSTIRSHTGITKDSKTWMRVAQGIGIGVITGCVSAKVDSYIDDSVNDGFALIHQVQDIKASKKDAKSTPYTNLSHFMFSKSEVVQQLKDNLIELAEDDSQHQSANVYAYMAAIDKEGTLEDSDYFWTLEEIQNAEVKKIGKYWILDLPKPHLLDSLWFPHIRYDSKKTAEDKLKHLKAADAITLKTVVDATGNSDLIGQFGRYEQYGWYRSDFDKASVVEDSGKFVIDGVPQPHLFNKEH